MQPAPAIRALQAFNHVPAGCRLFMIGDDRHWPHLRTGEWAVVDLGDTRFVSGELYLIQWRTGERRQAVMQVNSRYERINADGTKEPCIWFSPLNRPMSHESLADWMKQGRQFFLSDGPLKVKHLDEYLKGRVIGVFASPIEDAALRLVARRTA